MKTFSVAVLVCVTAVSVQALMQNHAGQDGWLVYRPDMDINLPETSEMNGPFKIYIARSFADPREDTLLRKAEAVYPRGALHPQGPTIRGDSSSPLCSQDHTTTLPRWGGCGNDDIEMTDIVTASAVRYYYDLTLLARKNPHLPSGFTALGSSMKYNAGIKFFIDYSHRKDTWHGVYVADLTLKWGFMCGELCGVGFTRNKIVVLDAEGNVLAMYLDAPVNREFWVS
ncbi:MAG TPA: hypothetical protein VGR84_11550 [Candidatus Acidoferrales bacterium]|nr:hypothetical protein [Candidatus Acidoferrales bacterium]